MADINEVCVICMDSIHTRTLIKSCSHAFCKDCIWTWSKAKHNCPLCNSPYNLLLLPDVKSLTKFKETEAPSITEKLIQNDMATDLQALDSSYFKTEVKRLLISAENKQQSMALERRQQTQSMFGVPSVDAWEERNWKALLELISKLKTYMEIFDGERSFDPRGTLQELYQMQDTMQQIWRGQVALPPPETKTKFYGADDYENVSSDEEDEYDDYDYGSKKKNRKPNGRSKAPAKRG